MSSFSEQVLTVFDSVDCEVLWSHLKQRVRTGEIRGVALKWFRSYLTYWTSCVIPEEVVSFLFIGSPKAQSWATFVCLLLYLFPLSSLRKHGVSLTVRFMSLSKRQTLIHFSDVLRTWGSEWHIIYWVLQHRDRGYGFLEVLLGPLL